jgi:hypothetical protein
MYRECEHCMGKKDTYRGWRCCETRLSVHVVVSMMELVHDMMITIF